VRSRWEANYARYLRFLGRTFVYEPEAFVIRLPDETEHIYHPDFLVDNAYYVEIKGWMRADRRQAEIIKAAQSQLPLPLYLIHHGQYSTLERTIAAKIKLWEYAGDSLPPKAIRLCPMCGTPITSILTRTKFCSIKCYAASRPKEALANFLTGGQRTRFQPGNDGSVGGKASSEARRNRTLSF